MPRVRTDPPLEHRVGAALMRGREDEGVVAVDGGVVVACSTYAAELLGGGAGGFMGQNIEAFIAGLDGELLQLRLLSALKDTAPVEFVVERPGRSNQWIKVRSLPLLPGMALIVRDVTDRELSDRSLRRKEQRLLAANRSLRMAHAAARAASWEWRPGRALRWLDLASARELSCLPPAWTDDEQLADWPTALSAEGVEMAEQAIATLLQSGQASIEVEVTGADGQPHWLRIDSAVTERDAFGVATCINGVTVDVTQAKQAGEALRAEIVERKRSEERQQLLVHELNHRVKNMLATVQSMARQTLAGPATAKVAHTFQERLMALAWAYDILTRGRWEGASLRQILERTLAPHGYGGERYDAQGPDIWLAPNQALALSLAFHELTTNALKYGALASAKGRVLIRWGIRRAGGHPRLHLEWVERGGPPTTPPTQRGFGSRLLEKSLARELNGEAALHFDPAGLRFELTAPMAEAPGLGVER